MIVKYSLLLPTGHVHDLFGFSFCFYALSNFQPSFVIQYIDKFKYSNSVGILPSSHFLDILDKVIHISLPPFHTKLVEYCCQWRIQLAPTFSLLNLQKQTLWEYQELFPTLSSDTQMLRQLLVTFILWLLQMLHADMKKKVLELDKR